jgi:cation diffusion facilitator family transporter
MKKSIQPADSDHPYGHGKVENIASLFQSLFLIIMGLILVAEGTRQALAVDELPDFDGGIVVMLLSSLASFAVGRRLLRIGRETDSPLLQADSYHFTMDTYTNAGVVIALVLAQWQGSVLWDRIVAILIGAWVIIAAFGILRSSVDALMDKFIPQELQKEIDQIILSHSPEIMGYHKMRSRRSGPQKLVDLHLVTCRYRSLTEAHEIADHIEKEIESRVKYSDVIIHIDPCALVCPKNLEECLFMSKSNAEGN